MNKSHITDEQVRAAREQIGRISGSFLSNAQIRDVLEAAFPEPQIKPIAFADRMPEEGESILCWNSLERLWALGDFRREWLYNSETHWLPASALPIPESVAVDATESAWREYCSDWRSVGVKANRLDFLAGYEAGQAGGNK